MDFEEVVARIGTLTDVRRISGAHVVDHTQLSNDELRDAVLKVKPQYLHEATVQGCLEEALYGHPDKDYRVLSLLFLVDVLLNEYGYALPYGETEEKVIATEQAIIDRSNEIDTVDLASGGKGSERHSQLELYYFVLDVAWGHHDRVSPDEANLLRNLRNRLRINEWDHRTLEAKLGKYPKPGNELHTRGEISDVRRYLQGKGLLFTFRDEDGVDYDVIPEELASVLRRLRGMEIRPSGYAVLLTYRLLRRRNHLQDVLQHAEVDYGRGDTVDTMIDRVLRNVPASAAIASASPRYGLTSDQLSEWCRELGISPGGTIEQKVERIIDHFDALRPVITADVDERARWYEFFTEHACRDYETLRSQHVIEKDLDIEGQFEEATRYLFDELLNHTPLHQPGSNHSDGLVSLGAAYLIWDNKSKESSVNLRDHIPQFHGYIEAADKPVPAFLVIGPDFTSESEAEAVRYHAEHFDRNILLITAEELKGLADEWSSEKNRRREEPFPLGLLALNGRYKRSSLGKLY